MFNNTKYIINTRNHTYYLDNIHINTINLFDGVEKPCLSGSNKYGVVKIVLDEIEAIHTNLEG